MGIDENERRLAILNAAAELLLRHGYDKMTMSDVADAVHLNRKLVYLLFPSKDKLVEALIQWEINRYAEAWGRHIEADPQGGTIASVYRSMVPILKQFPLMAAIYTQNEQVFGKSLRKQNSIFAHWPRVNLTRDFLKVMQEAGAIRQDVNILAVAFIIDALTPPILQTLSHLPSRDGSSPADEPVYDELMETVAEMLERMLTPADGAHFEAGKAILRQAQEQGQAMYRKEWGWEKEDK